ncbi:MAG: alanine--tRNA ligase [Erysipelotrichaceae bacterium]
MKNLTSSEVRQLFLDYFQSKGHLVEPSASLIPHNDKTLLWINAGVAALKKYFDGSVKPKCNRITNAQKSIRTNDIENVGKTARHHTFFEMLGNFSIGDYFKEEAIQFAWEFLTSEQYIGFDPKKLYVTVHPDDEVAYNTWINTIKIDPTHILKTADNFWEIGEGPCGPNSEIFYDRGDKYDPQHLGERLFFEELENDRYIEVWNVVFSQYDAKEGKERSEYLELPQKNIDTGMGLERLVAIVQDGDTNFDTDLFLPIIMATQKLSDISYHSSEDMAYRVIADHIRTITFALADGALFSNEGRGYVLRRILRRAVRFGKKLHISGPFMYNLVQVVADNMKDFYPYLQDKVAYIAKLVKIEEQRFEVTLNDGEILLNQYLDSNEGKLLSGEKAFKLYDTYGFPFELTKEIALEKGFDIDEEGFKNEMNMQKERARNSRENIESFNSQSKDLLDFELPSEYVGYTSLQTTGKVIGLFVNGEKVDQIEEKGEVIFDKTCFYAESGGQSADKGNAENDDCFVNIINVRKAPNKQHLHQIEVNGILKVGDVLNLKVDLISHNMSVKHHSSVHLLQSALKTIVGEHIAQAGSYVCDSYARFDFTHFEKISSVQLEKVEKLVNDYIYQAQDANTEIMDIEQAKNSGAIALFDEKYGDSVRVVSLGEVSKELCGGTHVSNTSEIGCFKIISEESIGSGIRRITFKVNHSAYEEYRHNEDIINQVMSKFNILNINSLVEKIDQYMSNCENEHTQLKNIQQQLEANQALEITKKAISHNGLNILISEVSKDIKDLKGYTLKISDNLENDLIFLISENEKTMMCCHCSETAISKGYNAGNLIKEISVLCNGNGGGKPSLANGSGKDLGKSKEIIIKLKDMLFK